MSDEIKISESELNEISGGANPQPNAPIGTNIPCIRVKIGYGDTLSYFAGKYKTNVNFLAQINNISNPNMIYAGQWLWVPDNK